MKISILSLILLVFVSCSQDNNEFESKIDRDSLQNLLEIQDLGLASFKKIVIIPNAGCDGCISDAEKKFIDNYKSLDTLFVFTRIADIKLFSNSLPDKALKSKNVLIDTNNSLNSFGFQSMYPSIIENPHENPLVAVPYQK